MPATCIITKMGAMRKRAAAMGIIPSPIPASNTSRSTSSGNGKKSEKNTSKKRNEANADDDEEIDHTQRATPPETSDEKTPTTGATKIISGRVNKPRATPRKNAKKDYRKIEDPFAELEEAKDENGENIFGERENAASEDVVMTGEEYESTAEDADVKVEEDDF